MPGENFRKEVLWGVSVVKRPIVDEKWGKVQSYGVIKVDIMSETRNFVPEILPHISQDRYLKKGGG